MRGSVSVDYGFTPLPKWPPLRGESAQASAVGHLVQILASDANRYMTGATMPRDAVSSLFGE